MSNSTISLVSSISAAKVSPQTAHVLSSLISIALSKVMFLDTTTALTISNLLHELLSDDVLFQITNLLNWKYFFIMIIGLSIYLKHKQIKNYYSIFFNSKSNDSIKISLFKKDLIDVVRFFMQHNPTFFNQRYNIDYGNPTLENICDEYDESVLILPEINTVINFDDTIHNVKGRIVSKVIDRLKEIGGKQCTVQVPYIEIWIDNAPLNGMEYIDFLKKWRIEKINRDQHKLYYHIKIMSHGGKMHQHYTILYEGPVLSNEELYKKYMEPYFSPHKAQLWKYFSTIQWNPEKFLALGQNPSLNLLLHGPPGSGKSTLAYRLAMALGRHLISFDLTCGDSRKSIYQIFQSPSIYDNYEPNHVLEPKEFILLLEEFDIVIDYLLKKKDTNSMPKISFDINGLTELSKESKAKDFKYVSQEREFALEDLLELFQGAVPLPGSIIIATTNHFDKIYSALPALFRPGRLTPVHFDNLNWDTLQELSRYYFKKEIDLPRVDRVACETSKIVELAVKATLEQENEFEYFQRKLNALLEVQH